ncbi:GroL Chaperonin GroEL (HSP60 family) [uncultured Caudovirales phage]|uniref:GroL Chaperonin GroEL (HSP60 family) n=1 Tax=uncultured Caudovirales phage TaxID=2100421 RepID=A0A6J5SFD0_9CAUD|nr:GroL Chaperonin GroEL (HSP60 family) [uncultured Caudovirales phage]CAB4212401.1 GroL Chaperonin GroEL (HSP60 family) [uncultured Caudovirales phage]
MKKKIILGQEAKKQILEGAELLYNAVSTTLGPKGQNAVIEVYGEPIVTHDGVTVAKSIEVGKEFNDRPGVRVGIEMIKASSSRTNDNVGDGTTSSTILAYHLIDGGMKLIEGGVKNPMVLRRELDDAAIEVLAELEKLAEPIKTEKAAIEIATISSENKEIGKQVGHMYHVLGKDGMVAVDIGTKPVTEYEIVEGYNFDRGLISPMMVADSRTQSTTINNPAIVVAHQHVSFRDAARIIAEAYQAGHDGIVFIADDFKNDFIDASLLKKDQMEIIGVKAPGFGEQRPELLRDIAKLTGTKLFGTGCPDKLEAIKLEDLGTCEKIVITNHETVITGGKDVSEHIKDLLSKLDKLTGDFDKDKLEKRIAKLRAKVGQIRVGGNTEMEAEERKYLVDDAVAATEAALRDGIVPGGGVTYVELSKRLKGTTDGAAVLREALLSPFKVLMNNSGERYGKKLEELKEYGKGFDVMAGGDLVDLKEHGIIDPVMVIRQAITNAVSVASSALTTGVLIVNEKVEEDKDDEDN